MKTKLAHVAGSLDYGGAENQVALLLNGLNSCFFDRFLITFKKVETTKSRALCDTIKLFNVGFRRRGQIVCIFRLYRLFKTLGIEVVQAHTYYANLYASIAARLAGVKVVMTTEHGQASWKRPTHHLIERRIISPLVSMRVAVSNDIRNIRVLSGDVSATKITVINNCVVIPETKASHNIKERLKIGTVGRLVPAKDYQTLIRAFGKVIGDGFNAELTIVGDGPERARLEKEVQDLVLYEHVTFAGFQANVDIFLNEFDIFVLTSITEGIPIAMLEAMAKGLPVVATIVGGIPEVLQDNVDGLLVESSNPQMIADTLKRLINDRFLRIRLGEAAREKIKSSFCSESVCKQYEQLYINLLRQV
jgi:glycosyltransferase involved in cell wall biosynthesis